MVKFWFIGKSLWTDMGSVGNEIEMEYLMRNVRDYNNEDFWGQKRILDEVKKW